ncbi:MAG: hypothetical protein AAGG75_17650 [Bacteroidota bacterium]
MKNKKLKLKLIRTTQQLSTSQQSRLRGGAADGIIVADLAVL